MVLLLIVFFITVTLFAQTNRFSEEPDSIATHKVVLDDQSKLISWIVPQSKAYDQFLHQRWNFIKTKAPYSPGPAPRSAYPQYYFYCDYDNKNFGVPGSWMNDIGEKIPNWFENARLYYAYTGDASVMDIMKDFIDYTMEHGTSPSTFPWPDFPYTTTNAGDVDFRGFTDSKKLVLHEIQVDHAGEMGLTYYRMFLYTGDEKYKTAAIKVANTLAKNARTGSATQSVWPYRVVMSTGMVTAEYGANWTGCYALLDGLVKANLGNVAAYQPALVKARDFLLQYPMKTGYWTDGHSDTDVNSNTYRSNLSASNVKLYMFDHPEFDPHFKSNLPKLIKWTEEFFVFRCVPGEPAMQWGANIVGEQEIFLPKMDYQTARYAAECARWYAVSGDETYKEKAYRSLNWVTYCNDTDGMAFESPLSKDVTSWWSDCYGECPRMFYHVFAAVPEWAPHGENHILYSEGILKNVSYQVRKVEYTSTVKNGTEFLRLAFMPEIITINGKNISLRQDLTEEEGYLLKDLGHGDFALTIKHKDAGVIHISR